MYDEEMPVSQTAVSVQVCVVVIDDHDTSRDAIAGILRGDGCVVHTAADGAAVHRGPVSP